ncbi:membrane-spanning 4-domains subfamily A member 12-like isoform X1 [Tupaia chinensis]|uniref:membrane-spanning 4-domains subfamily A member 12-like isoform X1 n=1 Tax=Tupaia chinensis TaxID=246437 RepID=UPI0003C92271|nr:membrane-spanning 4-domains subfamily A member 12-like isoform X1 [Tupaia chinensis]XP_006163870.1 membrane-spanning 4-domains subfamily A member 12-like isoform X1 [Tupaia chinensis]
MVPFHITSSVPWQRLEELAPQAETLENARPGRKERFFWGQPTLGALQVIISLLHISCGGVLAAPSTSVAFPTTYWYPLVGGMFFFISGTATLFISADCTIYRMKVGVVLNLVSSLCASLGVCAFVVELAARGRHTQVPQKSLSRVLLFFTILELVIASSSTFLGLYATSYSVRKWRPSEQKEPGQVHSRPQNQYLSPEEFEHMATAAAPENSA